MEPPSISDADLCTHSPVLRCCCLCHTVLTQSPVARRHTWFASGSSSSGVDNLSVHVGFAYSTAWLQQLSVQFVTVNLKYEIRE